MARELPVNWQEIEKACLAGVAMNQVAKGIAEKTEGITEKQLYTAIRKRASRERWPLPDAIIRRARAQALVAAGVAGDAKQASSWRKGESALHQVAQSREAAGMGVPREFEELERGELSPNAPCDAGGAVLSRVGGGEALPTAPPTATELVTQSLAQRGQTGLSLALDAALASLQSLQSSGDTVPIRSMQDLLTAVKATQAAAGLDKPGVAVQVNLNSDRNAGIMAWEAIESENPSQM